MLPTLLDLWARNALLYAFVRSVAVCVLAFVSANAWVFVGAAVRIQVVAGSAGSSEDGSARPSASGRVVGKGGGRALGRRRSADGSAHGEGIRRANAAAHLRPSSLPPSRTEPNHPPRHHHHHHQPPPYRQQDQHPHTAPPSPRLPSPSPKSQAKHQITASSLLALYEDIMAADAETIQTLQATVAAQQDVIAAQRGVVRDLRRLVEAQEAWIEAQVEGGGGDAWGGRG